MARNPKRGLQIRGREISWRTRRRAWVFGFGYEKILSLRSAPITDGGAFKVYDVWNAGVPIPKGEGESLKAKGWSDRASEFFLCVEFTSEDLMDIGRIKGARTRIGTYSFWFEPKGFTGEGEYACRFVMRPSVLLCDVLAVRDKMDRTSRAVFMKASNTFDLKKIRNAVELDA